MATVTEHPRRGKGRYIWPIVAALVFLGTYEVLQMRKEAGGLHNLLSRAWWKDHLNGEDLYNASTHFFKRGNRDNHEVCLTFDDGPHPTSCAEILDILKRYDAHATFFLVGKRIKQHPELAKLIIDDGFEVGNHTQDHFRLDTLKPNQVRNELLNCETNFYRATGAHMKLFRPPGMRFNDDVMATVTGLGYTTVGWDIGAKDFVGAPVKQDPEEIAHNVIKQLDDGVIILLHDSPDTAAALPFILDELKKDGYKVLDVSEMMEHLPKPIYVQSNAKTFAMAR